MNQSFLVLLSFLIGGGSGDLLDYVQTQNYWDSKDVHVSVDAMLQEATPPAPPDISKLITDLGAADPQTRDAAAESIFKLKAAALPALHKAADDTDPEIADRSRFLVERIRPFVLQMSVRRLMAIRTLGELKDAKTLPFLKSQLASPEMFVGEYARIAIGKISNQPTTRPTAAGATDSVWMLPANCRAVLQVIPKQTGPLDLSEAAARLHPANGPDGAAFLATQSGMALSVAEAMGDLRLDALSIGISDDMGLNQGCITVVARGDFDSANAARVAREHGAAIRNADGMEILEIGREGTMFFPSDHLMVLLLTPAPQEIPLKEMLETVKSHRQPLKDSPEMRALVQGMIGEDQKPPHALWLAVKVTDAFKALPGIEGLNTLTLTGDEENGLLNYRLHGECPDVQAATTTAERLNGYAALAVAAFKPSPKTDLQSQTAIAFLTTINFQSKGTTLTGAASLPLTPDAILTRFMMFGGPANPLR
jgi:hypothetical protein